MSENLEYTSSEEEALLNLMRDLTSRPPKNTMWIAHPQNYPRILKSANRILEVLHKHVFPDTTLDQKSRSL